MTTRSLATAATTARNPASRPVKSVLMRNLDKLKVVAEELAAVQAQAKKLATQRDKEILAARLDNWPWDQIEQASGMSRPSTHEAARRANKGITPVPRQKRP